MSEQRSSIEVIGARQNNLKNISVDIPRGRLTVITGVSGSGKSSLAFDVVYGEAQRRFLKSVSNFAKSRINQVKKPRVDFIRGLSPVIAIEQKKGNNNPRSTVGTVTDINDYLRLLFATLGTGRCPECGHVLEPVSPTRLAERIASLPGGCVVELYTPVRRIYGEGYDYLFERIRQRGYKKLLLDKEPYDLSECPFEPDESREYSMEILLDRLIVKNELYLQLEKSVEAAMRALEDELTMRICITPVSGEADMSFFKGLGCARHGVILGELSQHQFSFNVPASACVNCMGIGSTHIAEPRFLVVNPRKSIMKGALHSSLFNPQAKNSHRSVILYSLAMKYGFSLDTPFQDYPEEIKNLLFYGSKGENVAMLQPPFLARQNWFTGKSVPSRGFIAELESWYRRYIRKAGNADAYEPGFIKDIMVEVTCPSCLGARLKASRLGITLGGRNIHELASMQFPELIGFLNALSLPEKHADAAESVIGEITSRLELLSDIGLDYLCLARRSDSISGGELQRIKMSTQISSELMGMLYVMDEPSIGLHARDSRRVIDIMKKLRDIGNTVIVVEHDLETIKNADYLIELGPGAGIHGGMVTAAGTPEEFMAQADCLTGMYMSGKRSIPIPAERRQRNGGFLMLTGASENNLKNVTVRIPLGLFVCVTGVSGSGKSTLIFETLAKQLEVALRGARIIPGALKKISGYEDIGNVIIIDQSPIGRNRKSNPATYVGVYDRIRTIFAAIPAAVSRGYTPLDFSLTHANGLRCEHCMGDGVTVTNLMYMADVESLCPVCKGTRFSQDALSIRYNGKNISEVLDMTVEEAISFFREERLISHKLEIMHSLGLGYLTLGQNATTLSGGEAQRVKLSHELGKLKRGGRNLYILDEPTTGLHSADIEKLLVSVQNLVEKEHSVIVVEHNLDVIKTADYIIDMGPEGGQAGGYVVAEGTPEEVAQAGGSYTGRFLKNILNI